MRHPALFRFVYFVSLCTALAQSGCAIVPRYRREAFANPAMDSQSTALEDRSLGKMRGSREVAAGGDGRAAGGGCACSS
jgi:hypothetical protein